MKKMVQAVWAYYVEMNSEKGGGVSIKRNITWGIATLVVFVQVFSLVALYVLMLRQPDRESLVKVYEFLCWVYVLADLVTVILALRITSIEKLQSFVGVVKGNAGKPQMENPVPMPEKGSTVVDTTTETRQHFGG